MLARSSASEGVPAPQPESIGNMNLSAARDPAAIVDALTRAAGEREESFAALLEQVPVAAYRTDRDGTVTHFNRACITLAGRKPVARKDRWCVTWKLYTEDGEPLPHEQCPMAVALRENREVRGARAVAERPDGQRVRFMPFPTPLRDEHGELVGAVNLLVDLSDPAHQAFCREQAGRCRRLAAAIDNGEVAAALFALAADYESRLPAS